MPLRKRHYGRKFVSQTTSHSRDSPIAVNTIVDRFQNFIRLDQASEQMLQVLRTGLLLTAIIN